MTQYGSQYGAAAGGPPTCPRHPDQITYVRCQRCNRPVCPQCQRPAAVGVQCVDCVAAQAKSTPRIRTIAGGRARGGKPYVTYTIIGLCLIMYAGQMMTRDVASNLMFVPVLGQFEPWRFLTTAFLHGSIPHIMFNMYALYIVGPMLEKALGVWRYVALYVLSAIGGSVAVTLFADPTSQAWITGTVGASGAVFGLFAALALTMRRVKRSETQILILIAINFAIGFILPAISWQAHLGGFLTGGLLGVIYLFSPRKSRTMFAVVGTVGVTVVLGVLAMINYSF